MATKPKYSNKKKAIEPTSSQAAAAIEVEVQELKTEIVSEVTSMMKTLADADIAFEDEDRLRTEEDYENAGAFLQKYKDSYFNLLVSGAELDDLISQLKPKAGSPHKYMQEAVDNYLIDFQFPLTFQPNGKLDHILQKNFGPQIIARFPHVPALEINEFTSGKTYKNLCPELLKTNSGVQFIISEDDKEKGLDYIAEHMHKLKEQRVEGEEKKIFLHHAYVDLPKSWDREVTAYYIGNKGPLTAKISEVQEGNIANGRHSKAFYDGILKVLDACKKAEVAPIAYGSDDYHLHAGLGDSAACTKISSSRNGQREARYIVVSDSYKNEKGYERNISKALGVPSISFEQSLVGGLVRADTGEGRKSDFTISIVSSDKTEKKVLAARDIPMQNQKDRSEER